MLVRLVCTRPLLFCSIALDASKQKKIIHMVRILLAWLVECGRFRECLGNNPAKMKATNQGGWLVFIRSWRNVLQRWISRWKVAFWGRSALYQSKTLNFCWCHCFNSQLMVVFIHYLKKKKNFASMDFIFNFIYMA